MKTMAVIRDEDIPWVERHYACVCGTQHGSEMLPDPLRPTPDGENFWGSPFVSTGCNGCTTCGHHPVWVGQLPLPVTPHQWEVTTANVDVGFHIKNVQASITMTGSICRCRTCGSWDRTHEVSRELVQRIDTWQAAREAEVVH